MSKHSNLNEAIKLHQKGNISAAIILYEKIIQQMPNNYKALHLLGVAKGQAGDWEGGIALIQKALAFKPDFAEAYNNLGYAFKELKRYDEALFCLEKALALNLNYADAYNNLGNVLSNLNRYAEAIECWNKAIALKPNYAEPYNNYGVMLHKLGRYDEAMQCYKKAVLLKNNYVEALYNQSLLCLALSRFEEGWQLHENRCQGRDIELPLRLNLPLWRGENIHDKNILILLEQGIGDQLQMLRYIPLIEKIGAHCWIQAKNSLAALIRRNFGNSKVINSLTNVIGMDYCVWMMDLPLVFKTFSEQDIPHTCPYLFSDPRKIADWRALLKTKKLKVGLVWKGNAKNRNDHNRSMSVESLLPLFKNENIHFYVLQKDLTDNELGHIKDYANIMIVADKLNNFDDTAAAVSELDLVISVDTAVAHLAGALNKKVWILLPFNADWRWLINRSDSPWYPSAELFRQKSIGDWTQVIKEVSQKLEHYSA